MRKAFEMILVLWYFALVSFAPAYIMDRINEQNYVHDIKQITNAVGSLVIASLWIIGVFYIIVKDNEKTK